MLRQEAEWLAKVLPDFTSETLSPMLNIGSSTRVYRRKIQPWIESLIFANLERRNVRAIHCDIKQDDGVDIAGDIFHDTPFRAMLTSNARSVLCANMFEHVLDRKVLALRLMALVPPGGLIILTVPRSYPYHDDPIDTMYRPTPDELKMLFPGTEMVKGEIIEAGSYRDRLRKKPWLVVRHLLRLPTPFYRFRRWKQVMQKLYWLVRPYQVTCLILRKLP